jgi:hypothetical protein
MLNFMALLLALGLKKGYHRIWEPICNPWGGAQCIFRGEFSQPGDQKKGLAGESNY